MARHRWSGWPGAYCLKCGAEDPLEIALADDWLDAWSGEFDTEEHKEIVRKANICPIKDDKDVEDESD